MSSPEIQREDLAIVLPIIDRINPRVIVEIGTYYGGSAGLWWEQYHPSILITIDNKRLVELDYCHQLIGESQSDAVVRCVTNILSGHDVDLLFIDGSHAYEDAVQDFELYAPFVRNGGLIVFHDILYRNNENDVPTLWKEIKRHYNYIEIAQNNNTTGVGIITKAEPYERTHYGNVT